MESVVEGATRRPAYSTVQIAEGRDSVGSQWLPSRHYTLAVSLGLTGMARASAAVAMKIALSRGTLKMRWFGAA